MIEQHDFLLEAGYTYDKKTNGARSTTKHQFPLILPKVVGSGTVTYVDEQAKAEAFNNYNTRSEHYIDRVEERRAYRRIRDRVKAELSRSSRSGQEIERGSVVRISVGSDEGSVCWFDAVITHVDRSTGRTHCRVDWLNGDEPEWLVLEEECWTFVDNSVREEYDKVFSMGEVTFTLRTMSLNKAGGSDGIPMQCLQHLPDEALELFLDIMNKTWLGHGMPRQWTSSRLCPIPKSKPGAFRPIALTNAMARVADKLVTRRITHYLESCSRSIQPEQSGFRRGMSAEQQTCAFAQYLEDEIQKDRAVVTIFLDATSAYDFVRHDILLSRLGGVAVPPRLWCWLRNFIKNRAVHTLWGSSQSKKRIIRRGVPQGCSCSPMLWLAYMSPLISYLWDGDVEDVVFRTFCLADDVCITMSVKTSVFDDKLSLMQKQLDGAADFFTSSSIKLNANKSALVVFSTNCSIRRKNVQLFIGTDPVPRTVDQRMLGLYVDEGLTYAKHCDMWQKRVYARLKIMGNELRKHEAVSGPVHYVQRIICFTWILWGCELEEKFI
ncbi:conserved hypothetical protein [Perkinsus marinus ATCC 50983]|uniref:Reverse transcriptase domain-containing protein n=1 Tax=Perkinsus marinus (strain ATCC 50983 / TXsc) TaxID=423536 RepID=C5KX49_PERM5|nr:conserved hypothetical protein [Perkinsus marinus ATCC 50983]EER10905.1 conserved hypothetical protein [Perkinsus marinus ATCC 50983]|eukprot:XP_002779110.1 conserved hypothetical protein [Perkinsus marinus ATCC 50983]